MKKPKHPVLTQTKNLACLSKNFLYLWKKANFYVKHFNLDVF